MTLGTVVAAGGAAVVRARARVAETSVVTVGVREYPLRSSRGTIPPDDAMAAPAGAAIAVTVAISPTANARTVRDANDRMRCWPLTVQLTERRLASVRPPEGYRGVERATFGGRCAAF